MKSNERRLRIFVLDSKSLENFESWATKQRDSCESIDSFWGEILAMRNLWETPGKHLMSENYWVIVGG